MKTKQIKSGLSVAEFAIDNDVHIFLQISFQLYLRMDLAGQTNILMWTYLPFCLLETPI